MCVRERCKKVAKSQNKVNAYRKIDFWPRVAEGCRKIKKRPTAIEQLPKTPSGLRGLQGAEKMNRGCEGAEEQDVKVARHNAT